MGIMDAVRSPSALSAERHNGTRQGKNNWIGRVPSSESSGLSRTVQLRLSYWSKYPSDTSDGVVGVLLEQMKRVLSSVASTFQLYIGSPKRGFVSSVMVPDSVSMKSTVVRERHKDWSTIYTRPSRCKKGLEGMLYSVYNPGKSLSVVGSMTVSTRILFEAVVRSRDSRETQDA
jgi:hypothetical protein